MTTTPTSLFDKIRNKENNPIDNFIFAVIVFSAVLIGIETDSGILSRFHWELHLVDMLILWIFTAEIAIKIIAEKGKPWKYFLDPWNLFDFFIVLVSFLPYFMTHGQEDTHALAALRLIRLARAFRVFRVFRMVTHLRQLKLLVETLIKSIPTMGYVILLLSILFYIYSIIGIFLFGKSDPVHFASLPYSLLSLFQCISGSWIEIMDLLMHGGSETVNGIVIDIKPTEPSWLVPLYFISFYFVGGLIILNLFTGVIISHMQEVQENNVREDIKSKLKDDLDALTADQVARIGTQIQELQEAFNTLHIMLDRNVKGHKVFEKN